MSLFNGQAKRVLIVDDEPDICLLLRRLLIKFNLNVDYAYNITNGLEMVRDHEPGIVFLDMNLPDGNGMDFITEFKHDDKSSIIFMISAYDTPADRSKAFGLGVNYFLSKPFTQNQVIDILSELTKDQIKPNNGQNINN